MTKDPKFMMEQLDAIQMAQMAAIIMDDNVSVLDNGYFRLDVEPGIKQLYKNAFKSTTRLLDAIYKSYCGFEDITNSMKGVSYERLTGCAYQFSKVMKIFYAYMCSPEDEWRQRELWKKINELLPEDIEEQRMKAIEDHLKTKKDEREKQLQTDGVHR